jgi:hypothetical protein
MEKNQFFTIFIETLNTNGSLTLNYIYENFSNFFINNYVIINRIFLKLCI